MTIQHIFKNTNAKFYKPYVNFINENFNPGEHYFMIEKYANNSNEEKIGDNVEFIGIKLYPKLIKRLYAADKIILHSLMSSRLVLILFFQPWLLKKCYWVIWGSDLYYHNKRNKSIKHLLYDKVRGCVIKNLHGIITYVKGTYELAKVWYSTKADFYPSILYLSNVFEENKYNKQTDSNKYVLIGNSADPSNNHKEVLMKIKTLNNEISKIICPLSYGDKQYKDEIIKVGNSLYGDRFEPLDVFLPYTEYLQLLGNVDIAIFNHRRGQAMGNIINLLGMGKKIYMRDDIATYHMLKDLGVVVYPINKGEITFEMNQMIKNQNMRLIKEHFSYEKLREGWKNVFEA